MTIRHQFLPDDPKDGRIPLEFSENNEPVKPPSLIVSIHPKDTKSWTGNFQLGTGSLDTVIDHPDGKNIVVVAHGLAYVIDPHTRLLDMVMGDGFEYLVPVPAMNLLLAFLLAAVVLYQGAEVESYNDQPVVVGVVTGGGVAPATIIVFV